MVEDVTGLINSGTIYRSK